MTVSIRGNFPTERVDRGVVLHAKAETFTGQRKTGDVPGVIVLGRAEGAVETPKGNNNDEKGK
jgi:hypothetical protein